MINDSHTTCDICGAPKPAAATGWIVAMQIERLTGIMFVPSEDASANRTAPGLSVQDICGQACATKRFSQFLATQ